MKKKLPLNSSWEPAASWYDDVVGLDGHEYHKDIILPRLLKMMKLTKNSSLLDLGCGQGILERAIPKDTPYIGVDGSASLIRFAKDKTNNKDHKFYVKDLCKEIQLDRKFTHACMLLCLQNFSDPNQAIENASYHLKDNGRLFIVMNHPCFRIPRQSSWGEDEEKKIQYRRIDRYLTDLEIPIRVNPSKKGKSKQLNSYHFPLSRLSHYLFKNDLCIELIDEWCSSKKSTGKKAKMENRARKEFPLFLTLTARKLSKE